jgi:hypothetical protein
MRRSSWWNTTIRMMMMYSRKYLSSEATATRSRALAAVARPEKTATASNTGKARVPCSSPQHRVDDDQQDAEVERVAPTQRRDELSRRHAPPAPRARPPARPRRPAAPRRWRRRRARARRWRPRSTAMTAAATLPIMRSRDRLAGDDPEEGLAARADEHGATCLLGQLDRGGQQRGALLGGLAEADARIDEDAITRDAGPQRALDRKAELAGDLGQEIGEGDVGLHGGRLAA